MALVISDNKDYKNNQVPSSTTSTIDINTDFYVGGVPNKVQAPFLKDNGIPVSIYFLSNQSSITSYYYYY